MLKSKTQNLQKENFDLPRRRSDCQKTSNIESGIRIKISCTTYTENHHQLILAYEILFPTLLVDWVWNIGIYAGISSREPLQ